jgi:hypothetical protein
LPGKMFPEVPCLFPVCSLKFPAVPFFCVRNDARVIRKKWGRRKEPWSAYALEKVGVQAILEFD